MIKSDPAAPCAESGRTRTRAREARVTRGSGLDFLACNKEDASTSRYYCWRLWCTFLSNSENRLKSMRSSDESFSSVRTDWIDSYRSSGKKVDAQLSVQFRFISRYYCGRYYRLQKVNYPKCSKYQTSGSCALSRSAVARSPLVR